MRSIAGAAGLTFNADGSYSFDAEQRGLPAPGGRRHQDVVVELHRHRRPRRDRARRR